MFAQRLRQLRENANISRDELAKHMNKSISCISNWENQIRKPENDTEWIALAKYFNVSLDYLIAGEQSLIIQAEKTPSGTACVPIYGNVAAGIGAFEDDDMLGYEYIPSQWIDNNKEYIFLNVVGNSMQPEIKPHDKILVQKIEDPSAFHSGDIGVALVDGMGVIKKIYIDDNKITLYSFNEEEYPPRVFEKNDIQNVIIQGVVKKILRTY